MRLVPLVAGVEGEVDPGREALVEELPRDQHPARDLRALLCRSAGLLEERLQQVRVRHGHGSDLPRTRYAESRIAQHPPVLE